MRIPGYEKFNRVCVRAASDAFDDKSIQFIPRVSERMEKKRILFTFIYFFLFESIFVELRGAFMRRAGNDHNRPRRRKTRESVSDCSLQVHFTMKLSSELLP